MLLTFDGVVHVGLVANELNAEKTQVTRNVLKFIKFPSLKIFVISVTLLRKKRSKEATFPYYKKYVYFLR